MESCPENANSNTEENRSEEPKEVENTENEKIDLGCSSEKPVKSTEPLESLVASETIAPAPNATRKRECCRLYIIPVLAIVIAALCMMFTFVLALICILSLRAELATMKARNEEILQNMNASIQSRINQAVDDLALQVEANFTQLQNLSSLIGEDMTA